MGVGMLTGSVDLKLIAFASPGGFTDRFQEIVGVTIAIEVLCLFCRELEFEKAAEIRDRLHVLEKEALELMG
jgi:hypothetical protein